MRDRSLTLYDCFSRNGAVAMPIDRRATLAALEKAADSIPTDAWKLADVDFGKSLEATLDIPIGDILKAACTEFLDELGASGGPDSREAKVQTVPLLDFELESKHHPSIEVYYGPARVLVANLDITLTLSVSGIQLSVRRGRIERIRTGSCVGKATIGLMNSDATIEIGTRDFELPGEIVFSDPDDGAGDRQ